MKRAQPSNGVSSELPAALLAGWRGALDAATLGLADKGVAFTKAAADAVGGGDWGASYASTRAQQQAQDAYEQAHYPAYRQTGEIIGTVAPLLAGDYLTAAPAAGRIAFTAPKVGADLGSAMRAARPWAAAAGVGAGASAFGQGVSDALSGKLSDPKTYAADMIGGAAGGMATLARSPAVGAAVGSLAGGGADSVFTNTPMNWHDIGSGAVAGNYVGLLGHITGRDWSNGLDKDSKQVLGEWLAERTSDILDDKVIEGGVGKGRAAGVRVSGGHTIPDHVTTRGPAEAKFGYKATLSPRQKEAANELPNYHIYHFLPDDVGRITAGLLALANSQNHSRKAP